MPRKKPAADQAQPRAEAVHVVLKVDRIGNGEDPQHGDDVAENRALAEERHADAARGDR